MFMKVRILIGTTEEEQESAIKTLKAVFMILDKIHKIKVSDSAKRKAQSARKQVASERTKEEDEAE